MPPDTVKDTCPHVQQCLTLEDCDHRTRTESLHAAQLDASAADALMALHQSGKLPRWSGVFVAVVKDGSGWNVTAMVADEGGRRRMMASYALTRLKGWTEALAWVERQTHDNEAP